MSTYNYSLGVLSPMLVIGVMVATLACGQTFEVASVKPSAPEDGMLSRIGGQAEEGIRMQGGPETKSPDRINYKGVTLKMLLAQAYNFKSDQIVGPEWLATERFDIAATMAAGTDKEQLRLMLRALLADRFGLLQRQETKTLPVYVLTVAKEGAKLQQPEPYQKLSAEERMKAVREQALKGVAEMQEGRYRNMIGVGRGTVEEFAARLTPYLDRPIKNMTNLDGLYSFRLTWDDPGNKRANSEFSGPGLFRALQEQLGLRLIGKTEEIDVLIVVQANRVPTSN